MNRIIIILIVIGGITFQGCDIFNRHRKKNLSNFERITFERTNDHVMEEFIDSIMDKMTIQAKIGQMTLVNEIFFIPDASASNGKIIALVDSAKFSTVIREYQVGCFLSGGKRTSGEWYAIINTLQSINMQYSLNHIPVIFGIDHVHGTNYLAEGTIFPHELNIAATFNPEFANKMGVFTAYEAAAIGHHWNYAPILDIAKNKLWPRFYETYGEDTYLASVMGSAYVRGLQETRVGPYSMAACAKHFLGYSFTLSGWDRGPAEISPQGLQEFQVPVFKAAIDSGVMTVMVNSGEINGTPVHASRYYLTEMLRDQLGFQGVAVSDYLDIKKLNTEHFITENEKESTFKSVMAGIDMSMTPTTIDFCIYLKQLVDEGRIPEERIDLSVRRILRLKYKLGLFTHPYPSLEYSHGNHREEAKDVSVKAASESIVLMKNDRRLLPLHKPAKIVLTGMNANQRMALCGGWTYTWQGNEENKYPDSIQTLFQAMQNEFDNTNVILADAVTLKYNAPGADAIVIATGENPYAEGWGNIDDLTLPPHEMDLIKTAIGTGRPVILLLIEGRPRIIGDLFDQSQSVLFCGLPGMYGGEAISGILSGRINPSGKMSFTYPLNAGHIIPYNYKPMEFSYLNIYDKSVQRYCIAEFGTGMSYTSFDYSGLILSDTVLYEGGNISATVHITNKGQREGYESVLWFISDEVGTYTRPVKQLKFFEKKFLLPGEIKDYAFTIDPGKSLSYPNENGDMILEPGFYTLRVGDLTGRFRYAGEKP